jgi:hypothetical protein
MRVSAPAAAARGVFLHGTLSRMAPIWARSTGPQRAALAHLARKPGWTLRSFGVTAEPDDPQDVASRAQGPRTAIRSLTRSSGRQARAAIEKLAPTVVLGRSADHRGAVRFPALAENVDLFVMTWLSAKHAAADFIREHGGGRPLLRARGAAFPASCVQPRMTFAVSDFSRNCRGYHRRSACAR